MLKVYFVLLSYKYKCTQKVHSLVLHVVVCVEYSMCSENDTANM